MLNSIAVCGLFILFIPTNCGYYLWVSGKCYNCFRKRNVDSWVDSTFDYYTFMSCHGYNCFRTSVDSWVDRTFDNYTFMSCHTVIFIQTKTATQPLRNPPWYAGCVKLWTQHGKNANKFENLFTQNVLIFYFSFSPYVFN